MKCSDCGNEIEANAKFCGVCGREVVEETAFSVGRRCPFCGNPIEEDAMFCGGCGNKIVDEEDVAYCPECGQKHIKGDMFCGVCGANLTDEAHAPSAQYTAVQGHNAVSPTKKSNKGLIALIVVLSVVALGVVGGICWVVISHNADIQATDTDTRRKKDDDDEKNAKKTEKDRKPVNTMSPTSTPAPTITPMPVITPAPTGGMPFAYSHNGYNINRNPTFRIVNNYQYNYYCAVPNHFIEDEIGTKFHAPDNTALMSIRARGNSSGMTPQDAMNEYIAEVGGTVTYSASGETWFAVSVEKDGISYYMKGFADHYIRELLFSFPTEHTDLYDQYINYIEDNFKRTDV